ncbi:hypothetical protein [Parasutterella sp.]|uniref:hypothetical protein n=1 Tax=Parasutterella sp. TaxID=2049037 RepID=UPI0035225CA3
MDYIRNGKSASEVSEAFATLGIQATTAGAIPDRQALVFRTIALLQIAIAYIAVGFS